MKNTDYTVLHSHCICAHYDHAIEKHPYFCDRLLPDWPDGKIKSRVSVALQCARQRIKSGIRNHDLMWNELADCEVWEATEALANGDKAHAVEELYDCISVLLRTIDVLEGRQKLGKTISGNDAGKWLLLRRSRRIPKRARWQPCYDRQLAASLVLEGERRNLAVSGLHTWHRGQYRHTGRAAGDLAG